MDFRALFDTFQLVDSEVNLEKMVNAGLDRTETSEQLSMLRNEMSKVMADINEYVPIYEQCSMLKEDPAVTANLRLYFLNNLSATYFFVLHHMYDRLFTIIEPVPLVIQEVVMHLHYIIVADRAVNQPGDKAYMFPTLLKVLEQLMRYNITYQDICYFLIYAKFGMRKHIQLPINCLRLMLIDTHLLPDKLVHKLKGEKDVIGFLQEIIDPIQMSNRCLFFGVPSGSELYQQIKNVPELRIDENCARMTAINLTNVKGLSVRKLTPDIVKYLHNMARDA